GRTPRSAITPCRASARVGRTRRQHFGSSRCARRLDRPRHPQALVSPLSTATASISLYFCHPRPVNGYGQAAQRSAAAKVKHDVVVSGVWWQPDLDRCAGAVGPDVGLADLLAAGRSALDFLSQLLRGTPVALALPP